MAGLSVPLAVTLAAWSGENFSILVALFSAYTAMAGIAHVAVVTRAVRRRVPESGLLLLGVLGVQVGLNSEALSALGVLPDAFFGAADVGDLASVYFVVVLTLALAARFIRIRNTLHALSASALNAYEEERKRVSRELHDGVGQSLLAVKMGLQLAEAEVKRGGQVGPAVLARAVAELSRSIDELRTVATDLRPSALERTTLGEAVRWHAHLIQERSGIRISVQVNPSFDVQLPAKDHIYRIFQEALGNAVRHSGAGSIGVSLRREGRSTVLEIQDNGKGMEGSRRSAQGAGLGLTTIRERAELLNGSVDLKTVPGAGTTLVLSIPTND